MQIDYCHTNTTTMQFADKITLVFSIYITSALIFIISNRILIFLCGLTRKTGGHALWGVGQPGPHFAGQYGVAQPVLPPLVATSELKLYLLPYSRICMLVDLWKLKLLHEHTSICLLTVIT